MNNEKIELNSLVSHYFSQYPPVLRISQVAEILQENEPAVRAQIRRQVFPIRVHREPGRGLHVLLVDLLSYVTTGRRQVPLSPDRITKIGGKRRGRPTKAEEIARREAKAERIAKARVAS